MPLFFFISGYLFIYTTPAGKKLLYSTFVWKKVKRLLIPYIGISTLAFPVKVIFSKFAWNPVEFGIMEFLRTLLFPLENTIFFFWFLPTLFLIFLIAPLFRLALISEKRRYFTAPFLLLLIFLNVSNSFETINILCISLSIKYAIYFWIGCLFCQYKDRITLPAPYKFIFPICLYVIMIFIGIDPKGNWYLILASAVCGIVASYYFISIYTEKRWTFFHFVDGYSYQVYLLSWFPLVILRILLFQKMGLSFYFVSAAMFTGGILLPIYVSKAISNRVPHAKIIIGL